MGNPYPKGLEPSIIKYEPPDKPNWWPQPLVEEEIVPPDGVVADYLYVEPYPQCPRLKLRLAPRGKHETDEQYASYQRDIEQFTCNHSLYLGLCQMLCAHLGNHLTCAEGPCRRNGACAGIRDQDRYDIPLVLFPPCVPLDLEIIETYRQEIIAEPKRIVARGEGGPLRGQQRPHN
jgi:hypothetical protein